MVVGPTQGSIDDDDDDPYDIDLGEDDDTDFHEDEDEEESRCLYGAEALAQIQAEGLFGGRFNGLSVGDFVAM